MKPLTQLWLVGLLSVLIRFKISIGGMEIDLAAIILGVIATNIWLANREEKKGNGDEMTK